MKTYVSYIPECHQSEVMLTRVPLVFESYYNNILVTHMKSMSHINQDPGIPYSDNDVIVLEFFFHNRHK